MRAQLPYQVHVKSTRPYYEVIAAFDCEAAAVGYAGDCALANMTYNYRAVRSRRVLKQFGPE